MGWLVIESLNIVQDPQDLQVITTRDFVVQGKSKTSHKM